MDVRQHPSQQGHEPLPLYDAAGTFTTNHGEPGNAGSNTAADHVTVLKQALAALPERARPRPW